MGRFNSIYPFTSENIAGYMRDLNLTGKKVITVTGSTDHILNAILQGATEITTFDINPLTKPYMDLKISALKNLSYEDFIKLLLFESNMNLDYSIISSLDMPDESKMFWLEQLSKFDNNFSISLFEIDLHSSIINTSTLYLLINTSKFSLSITLVEVTSSNNLSPNSIKSITILQHSSVDKRF